MDPISTIVAISGEEATLLTWSEQAYDPTNAADYAPAEPDSTAVVGIEGRGPQMVGDSDAQAATAAFTVSADAIPANLKAGQSQLIWQDVTWTVTKFRPRRFHGAVNGYTLFLGT